ncbi:hypothetical protein ACFL5V_09490 [Fibrobacterota bacterium]
MVNILLMILLLCMAVFFFNIYFQLARIENSLKSLLENVETYLLNQYGEE